MGVAHGLLGGWMFARLMFVPKWQERPSMDQRGCDGQVNAVDVPFRGHHCKKLPDFTWLFSHVPLNSFPHNTSSKSCFSILIEDSFPTCFIMPTLRNPFRSHQQDIDPPTQARLTRARVRRSKSAAFALDAYRPRVSAENQPLMAAENGTGGDSSFRPQYQVAPGFQLPAWAGIHDPENTELTHKALSSNEPLPPLRGSGRFKSFLNRLRTGKPRGRKPLAGTFTVSEAPNTKRGSSMDPGQEILLPKRISSAELRAWNEERRQEALQKASLVNLATDPSKTRQHQSHHNPSTAHEKLVENRRPDVISPLPGRFRESKLSRAPSDPFSDDKAVSLDHPAEASSFHCAEPTLETPTYASQNPYKSLPYRIVDNRQATYPHGPSSLRRRSIPAFDIVRVPTMDSPSVGGSYLGRLQPELMRAQLEMMVDRLKLPLAIPPWASITSEGTSVYKDLPIPR